VKDQGSRTHDLETGERKDLEASDQKELGTGADTKILLQQGFLAGYPEIASEAWKRWCADYGSQARHYSMIAAGKRDIYITGGHSTIDAKPENTAEEAAGMYLLVKEAGGAVTDWKGEEVGERKIGMAEERNHDIIAAGTEELAMRTAEEIIPDDYH
jgi:fructose-1,6-bisphosphatase/inositol monophosphatase family enzyme